MSTKFVAKAGTSAYLGNMPITFVEDTSMIAPTAANTDQLAELLAGAGQKVFGEHIGDLTHNEVVTRSIDGVLHEVSVKVTYGAGGARVEDDLAEPVPVKKTFAAPAVPAEPAAATDATPAPVDPLATRAAQFQERTEFAPAPGRFPAEVQTATDAVPPVPAETGETDTSPLDADILPDDFPHVDLLRNNGKTKFSDIETKTEDELASDEFPGIGQAKAADIYAALQRREASKSQS